MSAKVFEFKKPDGDKPHHRPADPSIPLTVHEIFKNIQEEVLESWQQAATRNKLNEFIESKLPPLLVTDLRAMSQYIDFVNDLNVLSIVECKLGLKVAIFYPGCTHNNPYGWLVAFHRGKDIFSTPPDMVSEANARALNILLFLSFDYTMRSLGRE